MPIKAVLARSNIHRVYTQITYNSDNIQVYIDNERSIKFYQLHTMYYMNDVLHREDGPAVETLNGTKEWWVNGKRHREDGPAIERSDGTKEWRHHGLLHRIDGPAIERSDGTKEWWVNEKLHRGDGPAIEYANGTSAWYQDGVRYYRGINADDMYNTMDILSIISNMERIFHIVSDE